MLASTVTQMILLSWNQACRWPLFIIWLHSRFIVIFILINSFIHILLLVIMMIYLQASCFILLVAPAWLSASSLPWKSRLMLLMMNMVMVKTIFIRTMMISALIIILLKYNVEVQHCIIIIIVCVVI